jgi:hypothetical protein
MVNTTADSKSNYKKQRVKTWKKTRGSSIGHFSIG